MKITHIDHLNEDDHIVYAEDVKGTASLFVSEHVGQMYKSLIIALPGGGRLEFRDDGVFSSTLPHPQDSAHEFCKVVYRVWNSLGAVDHRETQRITILERKVRSLVKELDRLENAATRVSRYGATTGPQWSELTSALLRARAILAVEKEQNE